jgi:hypothetical protein
MSTNINDRMAHEGAAAYSRAKATMLNKGNYTEARAAKLDRANELYNAQLEDYKKAEADWQAALGKADAAAAGRQTAKASDERMKRFEETQMKQMMERSAGRNANAAEQKTTAETLAGIDATDQAIEADRQANAAEIDDLNAQLAALDAEQSTAEGLMEQYEAKSKAYQEARAEFDAAQAEAKEHPKDEDRAHKEADAGNK